MSCAEQTGATGIAAVFGHGQIWDLNLFVKRKTYRKEVSAL